MRRGGLALCAVEAPRIGSGCCRTSACRSITCSKTSSVLNLKFATLGIHCVVSGISGVEQVMGRALAKLVLSDEERTELALLAARRKTAQAMAQRARIVLHCARGLENQEVAAELRISQTTVGKWRRRFVELRIDGLQDEPRSGTPRTIEDARIEAVVVRTLESVPDGATHWSSRSMARACGLSVSTVQRIWRAFGLQAAPAGDVQAIDRSGLRRQGARCRWALCLSARACRRVVRR